MGAAFVVGGALQKPQHLVVVAGEHLEAELPVNVADEFERLLVEVLDVIYRLQHCGAHQGAVKSDTLTFQHLNVRPSHAVDLLRECQERVYQHL